MKKTEETEETVTLKKIKTRIFCDDCNKDITGKNSSWGRGTCCICGKDLCNECIAHENVQSSDYRGDLYCKRCWETGEPYRKKVKELEDEIEKYCEEWHSKCREK